MVYGFYYFLTVLLIEYLRISILGTVRSTFWLKYKLKELLRLSSHDLPFKRFIIVSKLEPVVESWKIMLTMYFFFVPVIHVNRFRIPVCCRN
jgi:hypothetical protein